NVTRPRAWLTWPNSCRCSYSAPSRRRVERERRWRTAGVRRLIENRAGGHYEYRLAREGQEATFRIDQEARGARRLRWDGDGRRAVRRADEGRVNAASGGSRKPLRTRQLRVAQGKSPAPPEESEQIP